MLETRCFSLASSEQTSAAPTLGTTTASLAWGGACGLYPPGCSQGSQASAWRRTQRDVTPAGCPQAGGVGRARLLSFLGRRDGGCHMHKHQPNLQRWDACDVCEQRCDRGGFPSARGGDGGRSGNMELLPLCLIWL